MSDAAPKKSRSLDGLIRHSAIYSAAPIIRQALSIGMHRLYTGWLGTAGFGVKEVVDFWLIALQQLLGQNMLGAMVRFFFDQQSEEKRGRVVSSCTLLLTLLAWVVCGTALLFSDDLAPLMLDRGEQVTSSELQQILKLVFLLIPFQLGTLCGFYYLQILKRSGLYTAVQTVKLLLEIGLNFYLIGALGLGVRGFLMSMLMGEILTSVAFFVWILARVGFHIDWRVMRPILVYAWPLVPVGFCQLALHQVDRRLLLYFTDQSVTGIYGHGYKISYLTVTMMLGPFLQIWQPWIYGVKDGRERAALVARISTYAVLSIAAISLLVILFGRQAAILLASKPAFWEAYKIIPFVAVGYLFWALYQISQIPLFIAKRTARLFVINLLAVVLNVALNIWLIPRIGFLGAGISTCATFALLAALGMLASRSEAHVPFEMGRILGTLAAVVLAGAAALWIDREEAAGACGLPAALGFKSALLALLLWSLWRGVLTRLERAGLRSWVRTRARRLVGDEGFEPPTSSL